MLTRDENGVLQFDGDAFLDALDEGINELKRAEELLGHVTEMAYPPPNLPKWQEVFSDDARRMEWDLSLHVRKRRDGTWRIHGQGNVTWNGDEENWAPEWAGLLYLTLEDALEAVPQALAAHTEHVEQYLTLCAQRMQRLADKQAGDD